jgi:hypothetical protein
MTLDEMILKAIPVNEKCAIEEQYNKHRRMLLKQRFNDYLADQLSQQFNAKPYQFIDKDRMEAGSNGSV